MKKYKVLANKNLIVGQTEDTLFSSFIEHLGRAVYGGIYQPNHPTADKDGFRNDVADAVKQLDLSLVRYPGGNFVSGYFWEDGIGPRENRPVKKEEAWRSIETNEIGTDEFMIWAKKVNVKPMMAVNMGTGTTDSARNLVQYCNADDDSKYANLRRKYGSKDPYKVIYWGLGNEMDGDWQIGHLPADKYVEKAKEAAHKMREVDPNIKFIGCGSSSIDMATFPEWDRTVVDGLYDEIDYLSIHQYFYESTTEDDYFASNLAMEKYIGTFRSLLNYVQTKHRFKKPIYLCFDEYNVWYNNKPLPEEYQIAPAILQENQSMKDALVFGGLTNALLNNCDIVKIACLAQLVNVIAPIMTDNDGGVVFNTIWYPYLDFCKYMRGTSLKTFVAGGEQFDSRYGKAYYISQAITHNDHELVIQVVNYAKEDIEVEFEIGDFNGFELITHEAMHDEDLNARNTSENPNRVVPSIVKDNVKIDGDKVTVNLGKLSWNLIRLRLK